MTLTTTEVDVLRKKVKTKQVLQALNQIEERDGIVTPRIIVDEARDEDHILHNLFEWNNRAAGDKYRMMQARLIINQVKVEVLGEKREAYLNVVTQVKNLPVRGYVSYERVVSDKELHRQVVSQALGEIEYWQKKYETLTETRGVINKKKVAKLKKDLQD